MAQVEAGGTRRSEDRGVRDSTLTSIRPPELLVMAVTGMLLTASAPAEAQTVLGSVTDARTGEPVATTRVTLIDARDEHLQTTLSDEEGRFRLQARTAGMHVLELGRLGYQVQRTDTFEVADEGVTRHDVRLEPAAIELEGITAEVYAGQLLHEATLSGVYARRARSPSVGGNRVLVRDHDPEFEVPQVVENLLPGWLRYIRPQCRRLRRAHPVILLNGWEAEAAGYAPEEILRQLPVREVVAIEYYRDFNSVPMSLRPTETDHSAFDFTIVRACGLLAVWTRGAPR